MPGISCVRIPDSPYPAFLIAADQGMRRPSSLKPGNQPPLADRSFSSQELKLLTGAKDIASIQSVPRTCILELLTFTVPGLPESGFYF